MPYPRALLLRYAEVALKGGNRGWFEERLAINARKLLEREGIPNHFIRHHGRVLVKPKTGKNADALGLTEDQMYARMLAAFPRLFGLASASPIHIIPTDREEIKRAAIAETHAWIERHGRPHTFRVKCKRSDKAFPEKSAEIERWLGTAVHEVFPDFQVDLEDPDYTIGLEVRFENSYLWNDKHPGPGGLPVGTSGKLLALLSGGIDSPVAALRTMRRGALTGFLHFYGAPFVGPEVLEKIEDLARAVNRFQPVPQPLWIVPFGKIQEKIALATNPKVRTILYRRMMARIGSEVARQVGAQALVTGDSLGQVASQTIDNLITVEQAATMPLLRPCLTMDKMEIIAAAREWETFEISIRPGLDCCTLFADRHPATHATVEMLTQEEQNFDVAALVKEALSGLELRRSRS